MKNLLNALPQLFSTTANIIIYSVVIIALIICFIVMIKKESLRLAMCYVASGFVILLGIYSTFGFITDLKAESYTIGNLELKNTYGQESFNYYTNTIVFNLDNDTYICEQNLTKVNDFDGNKNTYNVVLNDYYLINSSISNGSIYSVVLMDFYNSDGSINCNGTLNISIKFYSDKTNLTITTNTQNEADYFEKYFQDYGFRLNVYQVV